MGSNRTRAAQAKRRAFRYLWPVGALMAAVLALALGWRTDSARVADPSLSAAPTVRTVARRETQPTLDPARFVGKAALAHQVAREIPDTLDGLDCYGECDKHLGHKSLLSCYTDGHAVT